MPDVADLKVHVGADVSDAERGLSSLGSKVSGFGGTMAMAFGGAAIAGIAGVAAGFAGAVTAAAGFEQQMSAISAVSGATAAEMATLKGLALDLGKSTSFSASEAAQGIEELVKAGVSIGDIMGGAASASLSLAAAGAISVGDAAEIASNAMNAFSLKGADLGHVADVIAGAANASAISVNDFKFSLAAVGAVAATAGLSFDDTAVAIAELGQAGIKGSDAGTSLKALIAGLTPSSKTATAAMRDLGLITADGANQFFDASGKMKSMAEIQQLLQDATKNLTAEQKLMALETIFGSDAIRAASVLAKEGAAGFDTMSASMGKVTAEMVAQERLNNLAGSWEQLKGSVETLAIVVGSALLPMLKGAVDGLTGLVNAMIPLAEAWMPSVVAGFEDLGRAAESFAMLVAGALGIETADYESGWAALGGAISYQFGEIQAVVKATIPLFTGLFALFSGDIDMAGLVDLSGMLLKIFGPAATALILDFTRLAGEGFRAVAEFALEHMGTIVSWVQENWPLIQETVRTILAAIATFWEDHGRTIVTVIQSSWTIVKTVISGALDIVLSVIKAAMQVITGDWEGAWETIVGLLGRTLQRIGTIIGAAGDAWFAILDDVTGGMLTGITTWINDTATAISDGMRAVSDFITDGWAAVESAVSSILPAIASAIMAVWDAIPEDIRADLVLIATHIVSAGAEWVSGLVSAGAGMLTAIGAALAQIVSAVVAWAAAVLAPITSLVGTASAAATSVGEGILTAITTKINEVLGAIAAWGGSVVAAIVGVAGSAAAAAASIGQGIVDGIASGLAGAGGAVTGAILSIVRGALQAAKDALGISSPSKKAAKEIGKPFGEGILEGLASVEPAIRDKLQHYLDATVDYLPVARQIARVEGEIKDIRDKAQTDALFRAQRMIDVDSEALRLKQAQVVLERDLLPLRQDLARATREVSDLERGSLPERQQLIEMDGERKALRLQEIDLEKQLVGLDRDSKKAKTIQEQIDKLRDQDRLLQLEADRIRLTNEVAATSARVRHEALDDQARGQETVIGLIKDQIDTLGAEQAVFQANENIIKNATQNEIDYRNRLIAVFNAEGKPLQDRIAAGLALITQLENEGKISKELADKLREVGKQATDGKGATTGLGNAAAAATPQMDAAARKAAEMAVQASAIAEQAKRAAEKVDALSKSLGKLPDWFTPKGSDGGLFSPRGMEADAVSSGGMMVASTAAQSGGGGYESMTLNIAIGGRVAEQIYVEGRELAVRRGRVPAGAS